MVCHVPFRKEEELLRGYNTAFDAFKAKKNLLKPLTNDSIEEFASIEEEIHEAIKRIVAQELVGTNDAAAENAVTVDQEIYIQDTSDVQEIDLQQLAIEHLSDEEFQKGFQSMNEQQRALFCKIDSKLKNLASEQLRIFITGVQEVESHLH